MTRVTNRDRRPDPGRSFDTQSSGALLSVVVPMHNEQDNVAPLLERLLPVLDDIGMDAEVLCIDDGSSDSTLDRLKACAEVDGRLRIVSFSRNFGKEVAIAAGLERAAGDAVVLMDADLQHPPELIPDFVARWRDGCDMIYGVRKPWRRASLARRIGAGSFYWLFSRVAKTDLPRGAGDFRLLDRRVVDALNACAERSRFSKGLYAWVGFRQQGVPFEVAERANGRSGWSLFQLWHFALDAITAFSNMPLRVWSYIGGLVSLLAMSYGAFIVVRTIIAGIDVPGYASLITAIMFFAGVQLLSLGVIGEYVGRVFTEVKHRPLYVVAEEVGAGPRPAAVVTDGRRPARPGAVRSPMDV